MKKLSFYIFAFFGVMSLCPTLFTSCSDEPDELSYYKKGASYRMLSDYLNNDPEFSLFTSIVNKAERMNLMESYGKYTLFLPPNSALSKSGITEAYIANLTKEDCDTIVLTHLMDEMYFLSDMTDGVLPTQNMIGRNVQVKNDTLPGGAPSVLVNSMAFINQYSAEKSYTKDDTCENGVVHQITELLVNSVNNLPTIMRKNPTISIFCSALEITALQDSLLLIEDMDYKNDVKQHKENYPTQNWWTGGRGEAPVQYPTSKKFGYTAFAFTDNVIKEKYQEVMGEEFNSGNVAESLHKLARKYYNDEPGVEPTDYKNSGNALFKFMAYHLLDRNVQGYNFLTVREDAGVDVTQVNPVDWYTTMYPLSMVKLEHLMKSSWVKDGVEGDWYINRRTDDLNGGHDVPGIHVTNVTDGNDNQALNGVYFYIDNILTFDTETINKVFNTRIRMDFSTIFPEIMTNNMRMNGNTIAGGNKGINYRFPQGYLKNVKMSDDTRFIYWFPESGYYSMNGDEMDIQDIFDLEFRLPPVPFSGEWQIRLGFAPMNTADDGGNASHRGQVQVYLDGEAQGIPLDFRKKVSTVYGLTTPDWEAMSDGNGISGVTGTYEKWRDPETGDIEKQKEDFKILQNNGYYRGPHSVFNSSSGKIAGKYHFFANMASTVRKVLCTVSLDANKWHTLRLKNVSKEFPNQKEAMLDYIELVPKSVYAIDGDQVEDDL